MIKPVLQNKIKELYPEAEIYTFKGKGHFEYLNAADEYTKVLQGFLANQDKLAVRSTIKSYFKGRKTGDVSLLAKLFHPSSRLLTKGAESELKIIPLSDYLQIVKSQGVQRCETMLLSISLDGDMAIAHTSFVYEKDAYDDYLTLYKLKGQWQVVNKTFIKK